MGNFGEKTSGAEVIAAFAKEVEGRTFVITGPTAGGLGAQTAVFLAAAQPAQIVLLGRTEAKAQSVIDEILSISPRTTVQFVQLDLSSFASVRNAASIINKTVEKIDVLINNAGIMAPSVFTTCEGIESQFTANHLGHFLLTKLILPKVEAAGPKARIVNLTSNGHLLGPVRFDDYNFQDGKDYEPWAAYGQSKTANILFTKALAKRLKDKGIKTFAVHPGAIATNLGTHVTDDQWPIVARIFADNGFPGTFKGLNKDVSQGTSCTLVAALDPDLDGQSGAYLVDTTVTLAANYATDPALAEKLWDLSEKLVGESFEI